VSLHTRHSLRLMRCTNCSAPIRPVAAVDIDGTLGEYHEHFLRFAGEYLGISTLPAGKRLYDGSVAFRTWFTQTFRTDVKTFRDIKLAYRQGAQKRSMPVRPFARGLIKSLREMDVEVWLTTTRPYMRLDNVDPDTRFWLKRHGIKYDHLLYDEYKYEVLSHQVDPERVCFVLDDLDEKLLEASRFFDESACVLYATSWNSASWANWDRVSSEREVHLAATAKVQAWKEKFSS